MHPRDDNPLTGKSKGKAGKSSLKKKTDTRRKKPNDKRFDSEVEASEDEHGLRKRELIVEALAFGTIDDVTANDELRLLALQDGGLLDNELRQDCWTRLLRIDRKLEAVAETPLSSEVETQIDLDVSRSYGDIKSGAVERRIRLKGLLSRIFRRNPGLSYYQGYHDIVAALASVYEDNAMVVAAAETCSQNFIIRDAHRSDFSIVEQDLNAVQALVRMADPTVADALAYSPFWSTSLLLTCFTHDVPSVAVKLRILDAILASHPHFPIYLTAALVIMPSVKQKILQAEDSAHAHGVIHASVRAFRSIRASNELVRTARDLLDRIDVLMFLQLAESKGILGRESRLFATFALDPRYEPPAAVISASINRWSLRSALASSYLQRSTFVAVLVVFVAVALGSTVK